MKTSVVLGVVSSLAIGAGGCLAEGDAEETFGRATSASTQSVMDCFIDTSQYDFYTPDYCLLYGNTPSTASFRLRTGTPACGYVWYGHPECTGSECHVPINPGQTISLGAYYIACSTGSPTLGAGATAEYVYEHCPSC